MEEEFSLARLKTILQGIRPLRIGVVGDVGLAGRWFVDPNHPAAAATQAAVPFGGPITGEAYAPAGAALAACSLAALGPARVALFTVLGEDWRAGRLRQLLDEAGVDLTNALPDPGWTTPMTVEAPGSPGAARLEFINTAELSLDLEEQLLTRLETALPELDALVVADGLAVSLITPGVLEGLNEMAAGAGRTIFTVDSRERTGQFTNMVRAVDHLAAARWLFPGREPGTVGLREFAEAALYPQVDCGCPLFITLGEPGCLVLEGGESHMAQAAPAPLAEAAVGPVFLAALTAALAAGATSLEAARLGQLAAGSAARIKEQAGQGSACPAPSPEEILAFYEGNHADDRAAGG